MALDVDRRGRGGVRDGSREGNGGGGGFLFFASEYDELTDADLGGGGASCCESFRGGGANSLVAGGGPGVLPAVVVDVVGTVVEARRGGPGRGASLSLTGLPRIDFQAADPVLSSRSLKPFRASSRPQRLRGMA